MINIPDNTPCPDYRTFASSTGRNEGICSYTLKISSKTASLSMDIILSEDIPNIVSNQVNYAMNFKFSGKLYSFIISYVGDRFNTPAERTMPSMRKSIRSTDYV